MSRQKLATSVDAILADKIKQMSKETDIPLGRLLDRALLLYFEYLDQEKQKQTKDPAD